MSPSGLGTAGGDYFMRLYDTLGSQFGIYDYNGSGCNGTCICRVPSLGKRRWQTKTMYGSIFKHHRTKLCKMKWQRHKSTSSA
jgi:hypothetical protein